MSAVTKIDAAKRQATDQAQNIAQRINAAMAEVDYIQKEKKQGMNYSIVSHDAVTAKVRPILQRQGVVYYPRDLRISQNGNRTEALFTVRFENIDDRSDFIDVETLGYGVDSQDKGPGKAISYGVKYALLKLLGLETGDDPDEVQDERADHKAGEQSDVAPKRMKLDGPFTSKTQLQTAIKGFVHEMNGCGDADELSAFLHSKDSLGLLDQVKRDFPQWWDGGPDMPAEFVPLRRQIEIAEYDMAQRIADLARA